MGVYLCKRILLMIPLFLGITVLVYFLSSLAPGSPLDLLLGDSSMSEETIALYRQQFGLDQPVAVQYVRWLGLLLSGDLGTSYRTSEPVLSMILSRVPATLLLTVTSVLFSVLIAIPLGILAASRPYSFWDYFSSGLSFLAVATPNFFVGLLLVCYFGVKWQLFPTSGMYSNGGDKGILDLIHHMALPLLVLMFQQIGNYIRQMRSSMLEVLEEDYIRTARAKGMTKWQVIWHHGLRNALIPVVTAVGMTLPFIIGGAVVTEQVFSWPGLGTLMIQSIQTRDYPAIMGITVFISAVVLVGNLLLDLLYGVLDPRITYR